MIMKRLGWLILFIISITAVQASELGEQARADYTFQYDQYRLAYGEYQIKKGQYEKIPTFANQQDLIAAAKAMLIVRAKVWFVYFQALRTDLTESPGFNETDRANLSQLIADKQGYLANDQELLMKIASQAALIQQAGETNNKRVEFEALSFATLGALRHARLNYAIQELSAYADRLQPAVESQIRESTVRDVRLQGITEARALLTSAQTGLGLTNNSLDQYTKAYRADQKFQKNVEAYTASYLQVRQAYNLLTELSKDIEI
jgi:hypothetical protein